MGTNFLNKAKRFSLLAVMFFITIAMAQAQPNGGGRQDSTGNNLSRTMKFSVEMNDEFEMDYGFMQWSLAGLDSSLIEPDVNYELLLDSPISSQQLLEPAGMTITENGIVNWTPTAVGNYYFGVKVSLVSNPEIFEIVQNILTVFPAELVKCASIVGTVVTPDNLDSLGFEGRIFVFATSETSPDLQPYYGEVRRNGTFNIRVPEGGYKVAIQFMNNIKYYPNTTNIETAETIDVACGDSSIVNFSITIDDIPDFVYFTTFPEGYELNANEVGIYEANAVSTQGNTISYRLLVSDFETDEDVTASVDSETGVATFSSAVKGQHIFRIEAYSDGEPLARDVQVVRFWVRRTQMPIDTSLCAVIRGTVSSNSEENIEMQGVVHAMTVMNGDEEQFGNYKRSYSGEINADGSYKISVPNGAYKLLFIAQDCEPEFYNNASSYETAESITVECGDSLIANAELQVILPPTIYTLSGRVYDETTNDGVKSRIHVIFNSMDEYGSPEEGFVRVLESTTNNDGTYSVQLFSRNIDTTRFYVMAIPIKSNKYISEYYNNTQNIEEAELLSLTNDITGIDFPLSRKLEEPVSRFNISGRVSDAANTDVLAMVTLIRKPAENENSNNYTFKNMPTDATGNYNFNNVKQGNYLLFAMPINKPLLPGFFVAAAPATWNWQEATEIAVPDENSAMPTVQYDITLRNISEAPGLGSIYGRIERSFGKMVIGKLGSGAGTGISGVLITVYDSKNRPVDYAYTNDEGNFKFDKLAFGEFTLKASKIGFGSKTSSLGIDEQNLSTTTSMFMEELYAEPSSVEDGLAEEISIYPNPVQSTATLNFIANEGKATIIISDMQGREVVTIYKTTTNGKNSAILDVRNLNSGIYSVKVNGNNTNFQTLMNVNK